MSTGSPKEATVLNLAEPPRIVLCRIPYKSCTLSPADFLLEPVDVTGSEPKDVVLDSAANDVFSKLRTTYTRRFKQVWMV